MTLLKSFLTNIADAGRDLLSGHSLGVFDGKANIASLCHDLMSQKGEALGTAMAREVVQIYGSFTEEEKLGFFRLMLDEFSPNKDKLCELATAYINDPSPNIASNLAAVAEAPRQGLIRALNMAPGGTSAVVSMRKDLLGFLKSNPELNTVDEDFTHLLSSWFNRGFLTLERISWQSPACILEKLIAYEAVHAIQGWGDLRRRLEEDRRCYGFFHPALPDEPLIFVEVALVRELSSSIQILLDDKEPLENPSHATTAIFYSISNCQQGLKGISFGNFLIKQVVAELFLELPNLKTFATLSPVPEFRRWLTTKREDMDLTPEHIELLKLLNKDWIEQPDRAQTLKGPLLSLCALYLTQEKHNEQPLDPVSRFHLGNGASIQQINWLGDVSRKGLTESATLMVNYLYDLGKIERQHEAYVNSGKITCSREVKSLLNPSLNYF
jgi:malonyl-CoA decarboxylase